MLNMVSEFRNSVLSFFLLFKSFFQEIKNQIRIINAEVQEP